MSDRVHFSWTLIAAAACLFLRGATGASLHAGGMGPFALLVC